MAVRVPAGVRAEHLIAALQALVDRHDALRMRQQDDQGRRALEIAEPGSARVADCFTTRSSRSPTRRSGPRRWPMRPSATRRSSTPRPAAPSRPSGWTPVLSGPAGC
ncbi:hypothetical protein SAZ11_52825 [Streptomyces sp. FXJ1.4098]|nr:hypothetical protein [Streptomyces sp. FXJ1.4098]